MTQQKGMTLIELMISMVIGLLIILAATQLYITSYRTNTAQRAVSGILDANVYGLQRIEQSLRMAGLGMSAPSSYNLACSGIIVGSADTMTACSEGVDQQRAISSIAVNNRTNNTAGPSHTSNANSAVLTIQYHAPVDMSDCEGVHVAGPREVTLTDGTQVDVDGQVVIERYFLVANGNKLELRCDSGHYVTDSIQQGKEANGATQFKMATLTNFDSPGTVLIPDVDDFQIRIGYKQGNNLRYGTVEELAKANGATIVAVKMAIMAKGNVASQENTSAVQHTMFGNNVALNANQSNRSIRRVYESTTTLRNSRGS